MKSVGSCSRWTRSGARSPTLPTGAPTRRRGRSADVDEAGRGSAAHHGLTDGHGTPLALVLTGGDRDDVTQLVPLLDKLAPIRSRVGRPRSRPDCLLADRGKYRRLVWKRGVKPHIARRGTHHGSGLGVHRYVVERTTGLLHWFRRLRIRWEIRDDIHQAFMTLTAAIICRRRLSGVR
ncbi:MULTISPECIES: transposase [Actinomadura]|uniref:Transposase n=1 Tax=Actinomadura yumaensis TaxID=111807 RepID=A0ABW2CEN0_9ACTN|nr:transposase [Actinomadura sp. J1-007]